MRRLVARLWTLGGGATVGRISDLALGAGPYSPAARTACPRYTLDALRKACVVSAAAFGAAAAQMASRTNAYGARCCLFLFVGLLDWAERARPATANLFAAFLCRRPSQIRSECAYTDTRERRLRASVYFDQEDVRPHAYLTRFWAQLQHGWKEKTNAGGSLLPLLIFSTLPAFLCRRPSSCPAARTPQK